MDCFHFRPPALNTGIAEIPGGALVCPTHAACAVVKGIPQCSLQADIQIMNTANVQWLAEANYWIIIECNFDHAIYKLAWFACIDCKLEKCIIS